MKHLDIRLNSLTALDILFAAIIAVVVSLIGALVLLPIFGGSAKHIAGLAVSVGIASLLSSAGASFDRSGLFGVLVVAVSGLLGYYLVVTVF